MKNNQANLLQRAKHVVHYNICKFRSGPNTKSNHQTNHVETLSAQGIPYPYLHKTVTETDAISIVRSSKVAVERSRVELCEHKDLVNATIDAIAHRNVD